MQAAVSVFKDFVNKVEDKPLVKILNDIKIGTYKKEIEVIRALMSKGSDEDIKQAELLKKRLLGFTASGTFSHGRAADKIENYSQYVILDIDKLSETELDRIIPIINLAPYTYANFISTRGKGVKFMSTLR